MSGVGDGCDDVEERGKVVGEADEEDVRKQTYLMKVEVKICKVSVSGEEVSQLSRCGCSSLCGRGGKRMMISTKDRRKRRMDDG